MERLEPGRDVGNQSDQDPHEDEYSDKPWESSQGFAVAHVVHGPIPGGFSNAAVIPKMLLEASEFAAETQPIASHRDGLLEQVAACAILS